MLVESLAVATSGTDPGALGASDNDEEQRKQITSKMRTGERWLFIDNVGVQLKAASLARALTASIWEDRILGVSKTLRVPIRTTWVATGNNLELSLEIARRSVWIRLDARLEKPWDREPENFKHPDLKGFVRENRPEILSALLTLGRYWFIKGQPEAENVPVMGSFESWSKVIGGVLALAGVEGFLKNSKGLYEKTVSNTSLWAAFLDVWHSKYGTRGMTAAEITEAVEGTEVPELQEVLPDEFSLLDDNLSRKLGHALSRHEGVRYGVEGLHLAKIGERRRAAVWSVRTNADEVDTESSPTL